MTKLVEILFDESMIGEENPQILHNKPLGERFLRYAVRWNSEVVVDVARERGKNMSVVKESLKNSLESIGITEMIDELGFYKFVEVLTEDQKKELKLLWK